MSRTHKSVTTTLTNLPTDLIQRIFLYIQPKDILNYLSLNKKTHKSLIKIFQSRTFTSNAEAISLQKEDIQIKRLKNEVFEDWRIIKVKFVVTIAEPFNDLFMVEAYKDKLKLGLIPLFYCSGENRYEIEVSEERYKIILNKMNCGDFKGFRFKVVSVSNDYRNMPDVENIRVALTYYNYTDK
jgi:hypothetical protein